jgi:hypothetical protein
VAHSYVVERMLGEFAAAAVAFAKAIDIEKKDIDDGVSFSAFAGQVELVLQSNYPKTFSYYSRCLDLGHKHFLWTGPDVHIFLRSEENLFTTSAMSVGEMLDHPAHRIYPIILDPTPSTTISQVGKRRSTGKSVDIADQQGRKRKLRS